MPTKWFLVWSISLLLWGAGCDREPPAPAQSWLPVRVETLKPLVGENGVRYSASVTPATQVDLKFQVNGYVDMVQQVTGIDGAIRLVDRGDTVDNGAVLARINEDEYRDQVKSAEANLAAAQAALIKADKDFGRAKALYATESMTAPDYDAAQQEYGTAVADVDGARAQKDLAEQNLSYCTLHAPLRGVILSRNIEVGSLVGPTTVAFVIADVSTVKVVFAVPDVMLKHITLGDTLTVTTASLPGVQFTGAVTTISPVADSRTRVFEIEISIANPDDALKDGMVAALSVPAIPTHPDGALEVPITAIVRSLNDPQGYAVYIAERDGSKTVARLRDVALGEVYGNRVALLKGAKVMEQVVVSGVSTIWDGAEIRILP